MLSPASAFVVGMIGLVLILPPLTCPRLDALPEAVRFRKLGLAAIASLRVEDFGPLPTIRLIPLPCS